MQASADASADAPLARAGRAQSSYFAAVYSWIAREEGLGGLQTATLSTSHHESTYEGMSWSWSCEEGC